MRRKRLQGALPDCGGCGRVILLVFFFFCILPHRQGRALVCHIRLTSILDTLHCMMPRD